MTKRQAAPLILVALEERGDFVDIVGNIVEITAGWKSLNFAPTNMKREV